MRGRGAGAPAYRTPLGVRVVGGVALAVAGATHAWLWFHGYRHSPVGTAFLLDGLASLAVAVAVVARGGRSVAWLASVLAGAALAGYGAARTVGLFGFVERAWTVPSVVAAIGEALALFVLLTEALMPGAGDGPAQDGRTS